MRQYPTALGWIDPDSEAHAWHRAQVRHLARHLGYRLVWPPAVSLIPPADQVREADVDVVVTPAPDHLDALTLNSLLSLVDVESVCPRISFSRWAHTVPGKIG